MMFLGVVIKKTMLTFDIFLCLAAEGMWDLRSSNPQLTCLTLFLYLAFLLATLAGWGGGMA